MVAPEVLVVVELRLAGTRVLSPEHPELTSGLRGHHRLVGGPRRRSGGGLDLTPLATLRVVEDQVVVQEGLKGAENIRRSVELPMDY